MSRPFPSRYSPPSGPAYKVNGKIRAREVRLIGLDGKQVGVLALGAYTEGDYEAAIFWGRMIHIIS